MTQPVARWDGFLPFFTKEVREWWRRRAAIVTFGVVAALATLGTLATRIDEAGGGIPPPQMLDPTANVLGGQFEQWVIMASIFASIGLLTTERSSGTLAWTLSKPVSRTAVLVAKWLAALVMLSVFAVALPLAVSVGVATVAYGGLPDLGMVATFGLILLGIPAFIVALDLALATLVDNPAGIAAIAFGVFAAPYLIGAFVPSVAELWPTAIGIMAGSVAAGSPVNGPTVVGWAVGLVAVGLAGVHIFQREEL